MAKKRMKKMIKPIMYLLISFAMIWILITNAFNILSKKAEISKLEEQVAEVQAEKEELENEVALLNDSDYVTRYARENYVFTREGEQVAILPDVEE